MNEKHTGNMIFLCFLITVLLFCGTYSDPVYGTSVQVRTADFSITLNGNMVDNQSREFPFLVYKGITYVPMTYQDCRLLGLESEWSGNSGLTITAVSASDHDSTLQENKTTGGSGGQRNSSSAQIAELPITVNGKIINNSNEEYPLLLYRDITYFPLTWRFAVDEFGWQYEFTGDGGLAIRSDGEKLAAVRKVNLPLDGTLDYPSALVYENGYVYYFAVEQNAINSYRASINNQQSAELLHRAIFELDDIYHTGNFIGEQSKYLYCHRGGATMGTTYLFQVDSNGNLEKLVYSDIDERIKPYQSTYDVVQINPIRGIGAYRFIVLRDRSSGVEERLGMEGYAYALGFVLIGDDVYASCINSFADAYEERYELHKIHLPDNTVTQLLKGSPLQILGASKDRLYAQIESEGIVSLNLDGQDRQRFVTGPVDKAYMKGANMFYEQSGSLYKKNLETGIQTTLYSAIDEGSFTSTMRSGLIEVNFWDLSGNQTCTILDEAGKTLFTAAGVQEWFFDGKTVLYRNNEKEVYLVDLGP